MHRYIQDEMEFMDISSLGVAYRYESKSSRSSKKRTVIWAWEPLTVKSKKWWPQPVEQRTEKIWIASRQPVKAASKEGHQKDKERYREVV
jgi:hypothetical protein